MTDGRLFPHAAGPMWHAWYGLGLALALGLLLITALSDALGQEPPPAFSMRSNRYPRSSSRTAKARR